ncbi:MAG: FkbM family methyltransferase [Anaerolineales bacterium]|nr:FkbM family methyltransferase [Anaerolineales bacterium]
MPSLIEALAGNFVVANLGAGGDGDYVWPTEVLPAVTLIEVDGATSPVGEQRRYHTRHRLRQIVAGSVRPREFKQRTYWGSSSLFDLAPGMVEKYNLGRLLQVEAVNPVEPVTLPELLPTLGLDHLDYLKTDLEGVDFEVLESLGPDQLGLLAVQCELRTEPLFQGEPLFFEVARYLYARGFSLVGWRQELWRPASARQAQHLDGVVAWADALFMRTPETVRARPDGADPRTLAKHVLLAGLLGKKSYGEWLLDGYQAGLPPAWQADLRRWLRPTPSYRRGWQQLCRGVVDALYVTPLWAGLRRLRRAWRPQRLSMDHVLRSDMDH